jgi:DNA (cytosine-5)-methyltransferase 3A
MKVLSLFDGMACGMLAMQRAGISVDRYVAFEIDKYAVQTSSHNFPMIEHLGDVFQADFTEYSGFDFLVGGSPCTYWSIAQKNNRETEASGMGWELFSQYVRALREAQPQWFIYENNKSMSNAIRESITQTFGFEPICINSALVSAQNRQRLYWVGRRNLDGTYSRVNVDQPQDRGILLRDVLDNMAFGETNGKSYALTSTYWKGQPKHKIIEKSQRTHVAEPVRIPEYGNEDKARPIGANYSNNCGGGAGGKTGLYAIPVQFDGETPLKAISAADGKTYTAYQVKDGQITIKDKQYPIKLADGFYIIRKLTVSECKRLQTVPEWYEFPVSDAQSYKMLGNGWTVEVIVHLISATQSGELAEEQLDLFRMAGVY